MLKLRCTLYLYKITYVHTGNFISIFRGHWVQQKKFINQLTNIDFKFKGNNNFYITKAGTESD